jgi:hypothetical protein
MAAMHGSVELTALLLEHGATVDVRNRDLSTPLMGAAFMGRVDVLELLLARGADPRAQNIRSETSFNTTQVLPERVPAGLR